MKRWQLFGSEMIGKRWNNRRTGDKWVKRPPVRQIGDILFDRSQICQTGCNTYPDTKFFFFFFIKTGEISSSHSGRYVLIRMFLIFRCLMYEEVHSWTLFTLQRMWVLLDGNDLSLNFGKSLLHVLLLFWKRFSGLSTEQCDQNTCRIFPQLLGIYELHFSLSRRYCCKSNFTFQDVNDNVGSLYNRTSTVFISSI